AESLSQTDMQLYRNKQISPQQMRVINYFKGRIVSYVQGIDLGASVFGLVAGQNHAGSQSNFVVSYDTHQNPQFFRLENSFVRRNSRALFGRNKFQFNNDIDLLLHSNRNAELGPISDIVVKTDLQDTEFDAEDVQQIKNVILNIVPRPNRNDPELLEVVGSGTKTNASYVYKSSYGKEAFHVANLISYEVLHQKLIDFFENHPRRRFMHLPPDQSGEGTNISLHEYTGQLALNIKRMMNPNFAVPKEKQINPENVAAIRQARLQAFQFAVSDPVFEIFLMPEFFPQLLPEESAHKYSSFEIKSSSFETPTRQYKLGDNKISQVYDSVAFVRALITDRSLDLQMTNTLEEPKSQAK
ncbi:MAG: hypothetical protein ACK5V3_04845, partial [Bdellovibrionales bacterium]